MALMRRFVVVFLVSLTALSSVACGSDYIRSEELYADNPGFNIDEEAEIADTTTNRQVIDVLVHYRQAVVNKDFGALKRLISEDYYDNAGTTDTTTDDYSAEHLGEVFEMMAQHAQDIKYNVLVQGVEVSKDRAFIDYKYDYAYQYKVGEDVAWDAGVDVNRLELIQEGGKWRIVSGL
ncbi:hypothetical protein FIV42_25735 [Persicimonas caeni]|jgi:hypothetical protein|uniref:Nuclear transport factor 2 family protein n=1 Tax=Persicimonas caeni TaxID=2292766 RepID=A0A4Y6Q1A3_PERCE|nr:hypothetical protein [Persicimonas caeni]QDG54017.1 hypothetical protein FIV42_25735 [Persicimonas caeni]QED35238.1 hypothetical protein FRD00_25730 [Persicimonas caeni]